MAVRIYYFFSVQPSADSLNGASLREIQPMGVSTESSRWMIEGPEIQIPPLPGTTKIEIPYPGATVALQDDQTTTGLEWVMLPGAKSGIWFPSGGDPIAVMYFPLGARYIVDDEAWAFRIFQDGSNVCVKSLFHDSKYDLSIVGGIANAVPAKKAPRRDGERSAG